MLTELFQDYIQTLDGEAREVEPLSISFRDFIALEQLALKSEESKNYWTDYLADLQVMRLPRQESSPSTSQPGVGVAQVQISVEVSEGLKRLARSISVPVKSVLLAAHLRVMSLLSGRADVVTGYSSNGRPEETDGERVKRVILEHLPFRLKLEGGTWLDLVENTF